MKTIKYPLRLLVVYLLSTGSTLIDASADTPSSEALKEATAAFARHWSECGDLWITHEHFPPDGWSGKAHDYYMELKGVTPAVEMQQLTEADGLNGWKWKATVTFSGRVKRIFYPVPDPNTGHDAGWSEWSPALFTWVCFVSKKDDQVSIEENGGELKKDYCERIECGQIPQRPAETAPQQSEHRTELSGVYIRNGNPREYLRLYPNGQFETSVGGNASSGKYEIAGSRVSCQYFASTQGFEIVVENSSFVDSQGGRWIKSPR